MTWMNEELQERRAEFIATLGAGDPRAVAPFLHPAFSARAENLPIPTDPRELTKTMGVIRKFPWLDLRLESTVGHLELAGETAVLETQQRIAVALWGWFDRGRYSFTWIETWERVDGEWLLRELGVRQGPPRRCTEVSPAAARSGGGDEISPS